MLKGIYIELYAKSYIYLIISKIKVDEHFSVKWVLNQNKEDEYENCIILKKYLNQNKDGNNI